MKLCLMSEVNEKFFKWLASQKEPVVMEIGTKRSIPDRPTHHGHLLPKKSIHVKVDAFDGIDVDVVSDAQDLKEFATEQYDAIICVATLEHIPRPWKAIEQFRRVLKFGGRAYVESHQSFPLHGYPDDYFRFSTDAYKVMGEDAGLTVVDAGYSFPATIVPPKEVTVWDAAAPVYLNSAVCYQKR